MNKKYSIWFIPPKYELYSKLFKIISELSRKYSFPNFEPHVTLIKAIEAEKKDMLIKTKQLASGLRPFTIKLDFINFSDIRHKALFIKVKKTPELLNAYTRAKGIFNNQENKYQPHLSLMYGNFPGSIKQKIINQIGKEYKSEFIANSVSLFDITDKDENNWYEIIKFNIK